MLNIFTNQLELFDVHFLRLRSHSEWKELSEESLSQSEGNLKCRTGTGTFCRSSGLCVSASLKLSPLIGNCVSASLKLRPV
jgi:hypothetical protein